MFWAIAMSAATKEIFPQNLVGAYFNNTPESFSAIMLASITFIYYL